MVAKECSTPDVRRLCYRWIENGGNIDVVFLKAFAKLFYVAVAGYIIT